jgi:hypothetical protein
MQAMNTDQQTYYPNPAAATFYLQNGMEPRKKFF